MTFKVAERVRETSLSTGTGTYTLEGAEPACQAFSEIGANNYTMYFAWREDDANWEVGIGRYLATPSRLERTTIIDSSNGSAIDWGVGTTFLEIGFGAWAAVPRVKTKSVAGSSNVDLTQDEQRCDILILTGTLTGNIEVRTDDTPWKWSLYNSTAGAFTLTFKTSAGAGIVIPQKRRMRSHCDGTDIVQSSDGAVGRVLSRSSDTMLAASNNGDTILATGTFTQTFDAVATLGESWRVRYRNDGTGVITLDPNASELIAGATTLKLFPNDSCEIVCTSAALKTIGLSPIAVIRSQTISNQATVDFTTGFDAAFSKVWFVLEDVVPQTDNTDLYLQGSTDGGSTFLSTNEYNHARDLTDTTPAAAPAGAVSAAQMVLAAGLGSSTGESLSGEVAIFAAAGTARYKQVKGWISMLTAAPVTLDDTMSGTIKTTSAVNAARFKMSSGNINGTFTQYGLRKAA